MKKFAWTAVALAFTSLMPAWADGGPPSANPDKGRPSANADKGRPSANADTRSVRAPVATPVNSSGSTWGNAQAPTRVQQWQAKIAYFEQQIALGNNQYNSTGASMQNALQRAQKALAQALAAEAAGTPLPPILDEKGKVVPIAKYAYTSPGNITSLYN